MEGTVAVAVDEATEVFVVVVAITGVLDDDVLVVITAVISDPDSLIVPPPAFAQTSNPPNGERLSRRNCVPHSSIRRH